MAAGQIIRRYWDASCFIAILNNEEGANDCARIIDEAKEAKTLLYVSPIVQVEVIRPRGTSHPIPLEYKKLFKNFLKMII